MIRINEHYLKLKESYLFAEIARRVKIYQDQNPAKEIIRLGIGDVTRALPSACIHALHAAIDEMAMDDTFRGYGPDQGYNFLRAKIARHDFQERGARISAQEIFISDGAKCDTGNLQEIFAKDIRVAIPDPVYPVYLDTNVMAGRTGVYQDGRYGGITYLNCTAANDYLPQLPDEAVDLIYLCFPNNPTGATITKNRLRAWVDYAHNNRALILFDAAYETFIRDDRLLRSIYEVEGAREVAIEFRSFSKTAGFTGTRCAYTVVPKTCRAYTAEGQAVEIHRLWKRRHTTKFNGVSYPVQRAAEAVYSSEGQSEVKALTDYYLKNAAFIRKSVQQMGFHCVGGENSPYIWIDVKGDSWEFFDLLLNNAGVVCTPGAGFGLCGQGHIRLSAFNGFDNVQRAMEQMQSALAAIRSGENKYHADA